MKAVYISKTEEIQAALAAVNGRATTHTLTHSFELKRVAAAVEKRLTDSGVPKKLWRGVTVTHVPAGPGKAYARKSRHFITTRVTLEYRAGGWALTHAEKYESWSDSSEHLALSVPQAVYDRATEYATRDMIVA